jgi:hypothetical protein
MKVKSLTYNWFQAGSTLDRDGAGEDWAHYTVGERGITLIEEFEPHNGNQVWNYLVHHEDGAKYRVFNPNFVEYFPQ